MNDVELSVVLATTDSYSAIETTVYHLSRQGVGEQLELVLVVPESAKVSQNAPRLDAFARVTWIRLPRISSLAQANAAGIRGASAPVVVLAEDHSFPREGWAQALIRAHRINAFSRVAVGPAVENANPTSAVSWADFLIGYGPWIDPASEGPVDFLPGHNSSYRRQVLLDYGDRLESMLAAETVMHWDLRDRGFELYLEPSAKTRHVNFSIAATFFRVQLQAGRMFAANRRKTLSIARLLILIGGSPLIPLVRLVRILRQTGGRVRLGRRWFSVFPVLCLGLCLDGLGQFCGYVAGQGASAEWLAQFEVNRTRHITERDRREIAALGWPAAGEVSLDSDPQGDVDHSDP